jgi:hypothetical protein
MKKVFLILLLPLFVRAQVSVDEATARLNAKAAASTQPAELREEISKLRIENAALKKQLDDMKRQLAALQMKATPPAAIAAGKPHPYQPGWEKGVVTGMTEKEVDDYLGTSKRISAITDGGKTVTWGIPEQDGGLFPTAIVQFADGKVVSAEFHDP